MASLNGSDRVRAALVRVSRVDLEDERDELMARLDGCLDADCWMHVNDHARLDTVVWLLAGADDEVRAS